MCTQSACRWWSSPLPATELKSPSPTNEEEEKKETRTSELNRCENPDPMDQISLKDERTPDLCQYSERHRPLGEIGQLVLELGCPEGRLNKLYTSSTNVIGQSFDGNEKEKNREISSTCPDKDYSTIEEEAQNLRVNELPNPDVDRENKHQEAAESVGDQVRSSLNLTRFLNPFSGSISSKLHKLKETFIGQTKQESDTQLDEAKANSGYSLGYFTGMLSEAYKDTGRRLQSTREIIQNIEVGEMKLMLFQYVTKMSKELPVFHKIQPKLEPEPCATTENKVPLVDESDECTFNVAQACSMSTIPGVTGWPEGSMSSVRDICPQVFHQRLVLLPPALSQLDSLSSEKLLDKLQCLVPEGAVGKLRCIFWIKAASRKQLIPKPACLCLSDKDIIALSCQTASSDALNVFHHFNLTDIAKVQISLGGQHVRLIGYTEDNVLAVFTHSKELTQEFCKALLKAHSPDCYTEAIEAHPLLSGDLMTLSLDWKSVVPDIVLDGGLQVTCRFKRVLADLLCIIHGNMSGPGKPALGHILPLLYTSVKVMNATHPVNIVQFLLTDTHLALLREDGVFHPVPRGSSVVPAQPQFKGVELRNRSEVRCLFVKRKDNCLVVDITFTAQQRPAGGLPMRPRRGSLDMTASGQSHRQNDSWKLSFACTAEAVVLINHLCN